MVLQLGNWRAAQNPTLPAMAVSQSVSLCVSPCGSQSMPRRAVTCCLGQTKLCGQHLLVAHFAAFCFWLTGSLREAGGGAVSELMKARIGYPVLLAASRLFCNAQITLSICPVRLYSLGVLHTLRRPRASTRIPGRSKRPR